MTDDERIIREALQAGPTPGPWGYETASMGPLDSMLVVEHFVRRDGDDISIAANIVDPQSGSPSEANAAYIAACSPDRIERVLAELERLRAELETERIRLAACGVVAMANTPESASKAREMRPEYRSASLDDVERAVDEQMRLRSENERLRAALDELGVAIVDAGYTWTPEMRSAYERGTK